MAGFGRGARVLGSCARCLVTNHAAAVSGGNLVAWRQQVRQATLGAKTPGKKAATASIAAARATRTKTAAVAADAASPKITVTPQKHTRARATSTKPKAVAKKKVGVDPKIIADFASRVRADQATTAAEPPATPLFKMSRIPGSLLAEDLDPNKPRGKVDVNSPEFKRASRRWLGLMVGIPFLVISSWLLWKRLVLKIQPPGEEAEKPSINIPTVMWKDMKFIPDAKEPETKGSAEKGA